MNLQFRRRSLLVLSFFVFMFSFAGVAAARCTATPGALVSTFTFPKTISVPRDAPIGTILASVNNVGSPATILYCSAGTYTVTRQIFMTPKVTTPTSPDITGANGVSVIDGAGFGFRIVRDGRALRATTSDSITYPNEINLHSESDVYRMEWVKTSDVITPQKIATQDIYSSTVDGAAGTRLRLNGDVTFTTTTCSVTTPTVNVPLGDIPVTNFRDAGSTSTPVNFTLRVNCGGVSSRVFITFTDARNASNTGNTLPLSTISAAAGVGVQILRSVNGADTPINFGPDSSVAGTTNQFQVGTAGQSTGIMEIPLRTRYIKTGTKVTAGTANSAATFTMSYQ